jgi:glutamate racemase
MRNSMNIGVFDSGLGGLFITKSLIKKLPEYDYIYLGDTKRVPYGNRSQETIFEYTKEAVDFLFKKNCQLIIIACNTASARALRKLQKTYLPGHYPNRRILGVIIPTAEEASEYERIGNLATLATVNSGAYLKEIKKLNPKAKIFQVPAPLLVPLIENDGVKWSQPILNEYLKSFAKDKIQTLILGCTHYPILKKQIRKILSDDIKIISQEEIIPKKLKSYLDRHPEIDERLGKRKQRKFYLTEITAQAEKLSKLWLGKKVKLEKINY